MTRRDVVRKALSFDNPPYAPWSFGFTREAHEKLRNHYIDRSLDEVFDNHILGFGESAGFFTDLGNGRVRDIFGVVWDRSVDKDIGVVEGCVLPKPTLDGFEFPNPLGEVFFSNMAERIAGDEAKPHLRSFNIGFSLYERAWTLRGMENLMMDFIENPDFVHELLDTIADWCIAQMEHAVTFDIDAIHFGDDWGMQTGLQMGPDAWREFIKPRLKRMYAVGKNAGKFVTIHSCGKVDEVFDDLVEIGLNCFNPFQPEVMDVKRLMADYHGRLSFHGGLSTQNTLPYGTVDEVRAETQHLLELGRKGGYIFAPAHAVEGDVPVENMVAFIDEIQSQPAWRDLRGR